MTKDLEETLAELGSDYRLVVARLKAARGVRVRVWRSEYLRAAALALLLFLPCVLFDFSGLRTHAAPDLPPGPHDYCLARAATPAAIAEIVRTQHPDGGWANDFLTRQNALALKDQVGSEARLAYRKAVRNLRLRGVL